MFFFLKINKFIIFFSILKKLLFIIIFISIELKSKIEYKI
jgi:hypothetical protein